MRLRSVCTAWRQAQRQRTADNNGRGPARGGLIDDRIPAALGMGARNAAVDAEVVVWQRVTAIREDAAGKNWQIGREKIASSEMLVYIKT